MPDTTAKIMLPADFSDKPISITRRSLNALVTFAAMGSVALVLLPLAAVFGCVVEHAPIARATPAANIHFAFIDVSCCGD